jgi:hypothetical protein
MDLSSDQVRVITGVAGLALLLIGWFTSDSGMARSQHRERWFKRKNTLSDLGLDMSDSDYRGRDPSAHESLMGGFGRLKMLFFGAVLLAIAIFWKTIGAFLGPYVTLG